MRKEIAVLVIIALALPLIAIGAVAGNSSSQQASAPPTTSSSSGFSAQMIQAQVVDYFARCKRKALGIVTDEVGDVGNQTSRSQATYVFVEETGKDKDATHIDSTQVDQVKSVTMINTTATSPGDPSSPDLRQLHLRRQKLDNAIQVDVSSGFLRSLKAEFALHAGSPPLAMRPGFETTENEEEIIIAQDYTPPEMKKEGFSAYT